MPGNNNNSCTLILTYHVSQTAGEETPDKTGETGKKKGVLGVSDVYYSVNPAEMTVDSG